MLAAIRETQGEKLTIEYCHEKKSENDSIREGK